MATPTKEHKTSTEHVPKNGAHLVYYIMALDARHDIELREREREREKQRAKVRGTE